MSIYITQQKKEEIEAKIAKLESQLQLVGNAFETQLLVHREIYFQIQFYKEFLSETIVLPVEESWYSLQEKVENDGQSLILQVPFICKNLYPNGVIIKHN